MNKTLKRLLTASALLLAPVYAHAQSPSTVLVVANTNNSQSIALANYYMGKRAIPASNKLLLNWSADDNADTTSLAYYTSSIATPIYNKIKTLKQIDYIVLCRNLPSKISDTGGSVDSALAGKTTCQKFNPYNYKSLAFTSSKYGMYLVTRLDGWSWGDAQSLIDRSLSATAGGPIFMDMDPTKGMTGSYGLYNQTMSQTATILSSLKVNCQLESTNTFAAPPVYLGGYFSWGSNDANFSPTAYNNLRFAPGALAETLVSTSASNIRFPGGGQSQIAQLIHNGVTGVKGYVSEPYLNATANPYLLFLLYTRGLNLAESFYSASSWVGWKDVVLGDPLCNPYKH